MIKSGPLEHKIRRRRHVPACGYAVSKYQCTAMVTGYTCLLYCIAHALGWEPPMTIASLSTCFAVVKDIDSPIIELSQPFADACS
jgi:hypothetical protein